MDSAIFRIQPAPGSLANVKSTTHVELLPYTVHIYVNALSQLIFVVACFAKGIFLYIGFKLQVEIRYTENTISICENLKFISALNRIYKIKQAVL